MIEQLIPYVQNLGHQAIAIVIIPILLYIAYTFIRDFYKSGNQVSKNLVAAIEKLKQIKKTGDITNLEYIREMSMVSVTLKSCWDEYRDTLHGQKNVDAQGIMHVNRYRATALANSFFTEQIVISTPLKSEYFKHLPGILTGIGIIGTFFGLIFGLLTFDVTSDPEQVRQGLKNLLSSVGNAFIVSLSAIALAMWITWLEKKTINRLYTELDELCCLIDSLFEAGAGEEYLQRLVDAAETSATQAMQMKESIVTDLKQVLTELTNQQITTMTANSQQLSQSIGNSITQGLVEPLTKISDAVQTVGNSQGEGVTKLLTDVMSRFVTEMDGMFGSQMRGMSEMLVQTAGTIQETSNRFEILASQIQAAGTGAADAMSKRMEEALNNMQNAQASANEQMRVFVEELKENVSKGQSESSELTKSLLKELTESTTALVRNLQDQSNNAQNAHEERQRERDEQVNILLAKLKDNINNTQTESADATKKLLNQIGETTKDLIKGLQEQSNKAEVDHSQKMSDLLEKVTNMINQNSQQVISLTDVVKESSAAMRDSINKLSLSTQANIEKMSSGADSLNGASIRLTENLGSIKSSTDGLSSSSKQLIEASSTLSNATSSMQNTLTDQKAVREAISAMVADLKNIVENAKRDATLTIELVSNLEKASSQLQKAQSDAGDYLKGISEVLVKAHSEFANQLKTTLNEGNRAFQSELAQATSYLKGAIQDLGNVLDDLPSNKG